MNSTQISSALMYLQYMLKVFDLHEVEKESQITTSGHFSIITGNQNSKSWHVVLHDVAIAKKIRDKFLIVFGLTVFLDEGKTNGTSRLELSIKQIIKALNASETLKKSLVKKVETKPVPVPEYPKEYYVIETLLNENGIGLHNMKYLEKDRQVHIIFGNPESTIAAARLFSSHRIDHANDPLTMYVSLALPDVLLGESLEEEKPDDTVKRHILEHGRRLEFFLSRECGLKILHPQHSKQPIATEVHISGNGNGMRRVTFSSKTVRNQHATLLYQKGFACSNPPNNEPHVMMVDLSKSTLPIEEVKDPLNSQLPITTLALRKFLTDHNVKPYATSSGKGKVFFSYEIVGDAKKAFKVVNKLIPNLEATYKEGGKSFAVPEKFLVKTSTAKQGEDESKLSTEVVNSGVLIQEAARAMYDEIRKDVEADIRAEVRDEIELGFKSSNFIISRMVTEIAIPVTNLGTKIVIASGQVTIPMSLIEEVLKSK